MNESMTNAQLYIDYAAAGYLSGAYFDIREDCIAIYQETDESDEDGEGPDKYFVIKDDCPIKLWNKISAVARKGHQW